MKRATAVLVILGAVAGSVSLAAQQPELPRVSPAATLTQKVGLAEIAISYSRPAVRGRTIWGGLVPYGQVWRTGANEATTISFSEDVTINGEPLAAGKYALFTIPGPEEWEVIFNREHEQWGAFRHNPEADALRIRVKPRQGDFRELFTISIHAVHHDRAKVLLAWERVKVPFEVRLAVDPIVHLKAAVEASSDWRTPYGAANYCHTLGIHPEQALAWADASIVREETYFNLGLKARILAGQGKREEAIQTAERALALAQAMERKPNTSELERLLGEWKGGS